MRPPRQNRPTLPIRAAVVSLSMLVPCLLAPTPDARAAESKAIAWSGEVDVPSRYVWRGIAFSRGVVVNPSLTAAWKGLSLNAWANLDRDAARPRTLNELDWTLAWGGSFAGLDLKPSAMLYTYPGAADANTVELQVQVGHALAGPFSTFASQGVDVKAQHGAAYSSLGVGFELPERHRVTWSGSLQYGRGSSRFAAAYADPSLDGLDVMSAGCTASLSIGGGFSLRPHLELYRVPDRRVRDGITGPTPLVAGIALDGEF